MEIKQDYLKNEITESKWNIYKLKDIIKASKKGKIPEYIEGNEGNILLDIKYLENRVLEKIVSNRVDTQETDILILWDGSQAGKVFTNCKGVLGSTLMSISLECGFDHNYVYQYLRAHLKTIQKNWREGSGIPHVSKNFFNYFQILIPNDIKEQQKIAEILSTVDEQIDQTDQLIEKTKELKKGLMQQLLTKGIGHTEFKHSEIGEIPVAWEVKTLQHILNKIVGGGTPSRKNSNFYIGSIPWVTVKDMKGDLYQGTAQESINEEAVNKSSTNLISAGNVIIATRMALGRAFINTRDIAINQDLKALYLNKEVIYNPYFLYWYLSNAKMIETLGSGTTVKGIRVEQLTKIKIVIPPMEEQRKIAEILSSVDEEIEGYQEEKVKYEELKKGLMQQLLTGKKRVRV